MAAPKDRTNTQFARVAADPTAPPVTGAENTGLAPLCDVNGVLYTKNSGSPPVAGLSIYSTSALEPDAVIDPASSVTRIVASRAGNFPTVYCQVFDAIALPPDGTVPITRFFVGAIVGGSQDFLDGPLMLSNGLVVAMSTTEFVLTITAAIGAFFVQYTP